MSNKKIFILVLTLILILVLSAIGFNFYTNKNIKNFENETVLAKNISGSVKKESSSLEVNKYSIDYAGAIITRNLKNKLHLNLGFIWSDIIIDSNQKLPVDIENLTKEASADELINLDYPLGVKRLDDFIVKPKVAEKTNWLSYTKFSIEAPIVNSSFQDFFESNDKGVVDFEKPIIEKQEDIDNGNYQSVPIQKLLSQGVVHLAVSPAPGEIGQSYIVGHSSNYSSVKSNYNFIFAPLEYKSQPGDEFIIFDQYGRKLTFKVFEAKEISEDDTAEAYRPFSDKRVVTLQGSILEKVDGILKPTKRWLTRGELVL